MQMTNGKRPQVVIVGAGFGGLWAARELADAPVDVIIVDRNNYHTFLPLLYQVAAAELSPDQTANPVRSILRKLRNVRFTLANVLRVDLERRRLECTYCDIEYDYLILAAGSTPLYFGIPGADEFALPLRTMDHAVALRNHILSCFERASDEPDPERRRALLTFVIVGAGPTGVEFAGALQELINGPLQRDFPRLDVGEVKVIMLEALDRVLPTMPKRLGRYALGRLRKMGVDVRLQTAVSRITADTVYLKDGSTIPAQTVIWTAGHRGHPIGEASGLPTNRRGQVSVLPTLQVPDHPNVYVVGDMAALEQDGKPLPMVAPVAMQEGEAAACNIIRQIAGEEPQPFRYKDSGMLAVVGRNAAVADLGRVTFTGFPAWALWLGYHLYKLIGFRNRIFVLLSWAWDYLFFDRKVRLILPIEEAMVPRPVQPEPERVAAQSDGRR